MGPFLFGYLAAQPIATGGTLSFAMTPIRFGSVVYPPGGQFFRDTQTRPQWVGVHSGHVLVSQGTYQFSVPAGHHFFMVPGPSYHLAFSPRYRTRHTWLDLEGQWPDHLRFLMSAPAPRALSPAQNQMVEVLCGFSKKDSHPGGFFYDLAGAFLAEALKQFAVEASEAPPQNPSVEKTLAFMEAHLSEPLDLATLADGLALSREHLVRLFRRALGRTPMACLWALRLERAKDLLAHTGLPLEALANQAGFSTLAHFSRRFKAATGETPSAHRRRVSAKSAKGSPP